MLDLNRVFELGIQAHIKEINPAAYPQIATWMGWPQDPAPTPTYVPPPLFPTYPFPQPELTEEEKWKQCLASVASSALNKQGGV